MTMFDQNKRLIRDSAGNRWAKCVLCGKIDDVDNFLCYGGRGQINIGKFRDCVRKLDKDLDG